MKANKFIGILMALGMTLALIMTGCAGSGKDAQSAAGDPSTWPDGWEPIEETAQSAQSGTGAAEGAVQAAPAEQDGTAQTQDSEAPAPAEAAAAGSDAAETASTTSAEQSETAPEPESSAPVSPSGDLTFDDLKYMDFYFSSGAGGWMTVLNIKKDGAFSGNYHDSEMGETSEQAPHGAVYYCDFNGYFADLTKVNDYTYSTTVTQLNYDYETGTDEVRDQIMYHYVDAYGLSDAETLYIYTPDAPVEELPEGFMNWVRIARMHPESPTLDLYGIYNEKGDAGFAGTPEELSAGFIQRRMDYTEQEAARLEKVLQSDIPQIQMNFTSDELYGIWDDQLNLIWRYLKTSLDAGAMKTLTDEQVKWIDEKEAAVAAAAAEYEGGSIAPLVANRKGAELTSARVYKLMEYVK